MVQPWYYFYDMNFELRSFMTNLHVVLLLHLETCIVLTHNWHDAHMLFDGVDLLWTTVVSCHRILIHIYLMLLNATHTIFLDTLLLLVTYWNICDNWISFSWSALAGEIFVLYGGTISHIWVMVKVSLVT